VFSAVLWITSGFVHLSLGAVTSAGSMYIGHLATGIRIAYDKPHDK
jgi:hypothetical protein